MPLGAKHVFGRVGVEEVYLVSVCRMLTIDTRCREITLGRFLGKCIRPLIVLLYNQRPPRKKDLHCDESMLTPVTTADADTGICSTEPDGYLS